MSLIFVSHAAVDQEIASAFRGNLIADFLGMCDVFVSSNLDSINAGQEWQQTIKTNLVNADIVVGLLSPVAVTRGWVFVEFGAGWIRGVPTIPLCHSGLEPDSLPPPLNAFQGLRLSDRLHLEHLYSLISDAVGCQKPNVDFAVRVGAYNQITTKHQLERGIVGWLRQLSSWNPNMLAKLSQHQADDDVLVPAHVDHIMLDFASDATKAQMLLVEGSGFAMGTRVGAQASIYKLTPLERFGEFAALL